MRRDKDQYNAQYIGRIALGGAFVILGGLVVTGAMRDRAFRHIRQVATKSGIPLSKEQIFPAYTGDHSMNAFELVSSLKGISKEKVITKYASFKDDELGDIRAGLVRSAPYLDIVTEMAQRPDYAPTYKGDTPAKIEFPDFGTLKSSVQLLTLRARVRVADHDYEGALQDIDTCVKINNLLKSHPTLIAALVRLSMSTTTLKAIAECGPQFAQDSRIVESMKKEVDKIEPINFNTAYTGEAFFQCSLAMDRFDSKSLGVEPNTQSMVQDVVVESTRPVWGQALVEAWSKDLAEIRKKPTDSSSPALSLPNVQELQRQPGVVGSVASIIAPVFAQFVGSVHRVEARKDLVKMELNALSSRTTPSPVGTKDPFGTEPYRVLTSSSGWTLYSLGLDGIDNGGQIQKGTSNDIVIRFENGKATMVGQ